MKRVNFDPVLEDKKARIMEQFNQENGPERTDDVLFQEPQSSDAVPATKEELEERVIEALKTVYDPEIPVNIYDLGLIYKVEINGNFADIDMTLTAPGCPVAATFPGMVERTVTLVPGIGGAAVELVWDPPWTQDLISEAARLELGLI
jgi:FeS assembly SUF system protein